MSHTELMTRFEYLQSLDPSQRSEAAARFDHQIEYDQLTTAPLDPLELQQAEARLFMDRFVQVVVDENLPYSTQLLFSGRQLPNHLEETLGIIRARIEQPSAEEITHTAKQERQKRMDYLRSRYGCG